MCGHPGESECHSREPDSVMISQCPITNDDTVDLTTPYSYAILDIITVLFTVSVY